MQISPRAAFWVSLPYVASRSSMHPKRPAGCSTNQDEVNTSIRNDSTSPTPYETIQPRHLNTKLFNLVVSGTLTSEIALNTILNHPLKTLHHTEPPRSWTTVLLPHLKTVTSMSVPKENMGVAYESGASSECDSVGEAENLQGNDRTFGCNISVLQSDFEI